jgi:hypothetical protein
MSSPNKTVPDIEGIQLLDNTKLAPEYRKFRRDQLYYIDSVQYVPRDEAMKPVGQRAKGLPRVLAITPAALFVCDANGVMERATRVHLIKGVSWEATTRRAFITTTDVSRVVLHVTEEYDVMFEFDPADKEHTRVRDFLNVLRALYQHLAKKPLVVERLGTGGDKPGSVDEAYSGTAPATFMTPAQILALNAMRKRFDVIVANSGAEFMEEEGRLQKLRKAVETKSQEIVILQECSNADPAVQQGQLEKAKRDLESAIQTKTGHDMDLTRIVGEVEELRLRLKVERATFDSLVSAAAAKYQDLPEYKQQADAEAAIRRGQTREVERATTALTALKTRALVTTTTYAGPDAPRARELESKVRSAVDQWERDSDADLKLQARLETETAALRDVLEDVRTIMQRKELRINALPKPHTFGAPSLPGVARHADPVPAPAPAAAAPVPVAAAAAAAPSVAAPAPFDDDDDLFGGPAPAVPAAAPAEVAAPSALDAFDDDDDLLGGSAPNAAATGAIPAAPAGEPSAHPEIDDSLI